MLFHFDFSDLPKKQYLHDNQTEICLRSATPLECVIMFIWVMHPRKDLCEAGTVLNILIQTRYLFKDGILFETFITCNWKIECSEVGCVFVIQLTYFRPWKTKRNNEACIKW